MMHEHHPVICGRCHDECWYGFVVVGLDVYCVACAETMRNARLFESLNDLSDWLRDVFGYEVVA